MTGKKSVGDWPWARRLTGQADENRVCRADCRMVSAKLFAGILTKIIPSANFKSNYLRILKNHGISSKNIHWVLYCSFIDPKIHSLSLMLKIQIYYNVGYSFFVIKKQLAEVFLFSLRRDEIRGLLYERVCDRLGG
jgi:hypothetical protein